jgi:carboxymethylenebutenolidase
MFEGKTPISLRATSTLLTAVLLLSCTEDQSTSDDAEKQAAIANVDAMVREHADDTASPSPGAELAPVRAVNSLEIPYTELLDELVYGYFSSPEDMFEPLPAVIMIHEWWGLNDNVKAMADRLAAEGYIVFAVDLYGGAVAKSPAEARELMMSVVEDPEFANNNIRAAYEFVTSTAGAPRVGSLGWCFGGGWSLNTAKLFPNDLDASVIYYGQVTDDDEQLRPIEVPILGLFGAEDRGISVESVNAFRATLERLRKNYDIHIYPGAGHAFANPSGQNYDAKVADDAWRRTLEFLDLHLSVNVADEG